MAQFRRIVLDIRRLAGVYAFIQSDAGQEVSAIMSGMSSRVKRSIALAVLLVCSGFSQAGAEQRDLRKFLVGKWRQPTQAGYNETVLEAGGFFKITIYQTGVSEHAYLSGAWEIRNGDQLWTHNMAWYPIYVRHYNGTRTKLQLPEWESTRIQVIDANHVRSGSAVATRVTQ